MSESVRLQATAHHGITPQVMRLGVTLLVELDMTAAQRLANVHALLGGMSEQEAFEGMKALFPSWFLEEQPV